MIPGLIRADRYRIPEPRLSSSTPRALLTRPAPYCL